MLSSPHDMENLPAASNWSREMGYLALLFGLFVLPRALQRFRIPAPVTSVGIGMVCGMGFGWFHGDSTISLLSTLGIVSLFLFAGLEIDMKALQKQGFVLGQHIVIQGLALSGIAWTFSRVLNLGFRPAILIGLAILTPSTGFILATLETLGLSRAEQSWVRTKAIGAEIAALGVMFWTLQSSSTERLLLSSVILIGLVALLPALFRIFARRLAPIAPKSEFAFLLMMALLCATITRELGVYYLLGAFVVGAAAQTLRKELPSMASEEMLRGVEFFASFFVPFYFFHAGVEMKADEFSLSAFAAGGAFLVAAIPLRMGLVTLHRKLALSESAGSGARIGASMSPTLVFTLVLAEILRDRFGTANWMFGGLVLYALGSTLVPSLVLRGQPLDINLREDPLGLGVDAEKDAEPSSLSS